MGRARRQYRITRKGQGLMTEYNSELKAIIPTSKLTDLRTENLPFSELNIPYALVKECSLLNCIAEVLINQMRHHKMGIPIVQLVAAGSITSKSSLLARRLKTSS